MKVDLNNKVALVTGASGAIGSAIAIAFAENGADVVVNVFSNLEKGKKVAEKIESLGRKAIVSGLM
ncbi:MAG: SDR family NAD(P)-dependent oxidoreductase [Thermoanaerobacteraceae bacterium]|nr:SDR family NAD(P)-dependent oxidoreductase [Thermoanaerobacteraceae bacterium]